MDDAQRRYVGDGRQLVVAEVRGPHASVLKREIIGERHAEAVHEPTLELTAQPDRVDDLTDVDRKHGREHAHRAGLRIDCDLDRLRTCAMIGRGRVESRGRLERLASTERASGVRDRPSAELLLYGA